MTTIRFITLGVLGSALLLSASLPAQEIVTETTTVEQQPSETVTPSTEASPLTQLSPDDRTLRAGSPASVPTFESPRRIHFSAGATGGYDDNVNLLPNGSPSWYANPTAVFSYGFGSSRLALTLLTGAGLTYYFDHPNGHDYDPNLFLQLSAVYRATPRLTLNFSTASSYQGQPDFSTQLSVNTRLGNFFHSVNRVSADYQVTGRFSTVTSYELGTLEYSSSIGSLDNRLQHTFAEELRFLVFPTTTATAEYRFTYTDFANVPSDSTTHSFIAGVDQSFSPRFDASLRGGLQLRWPETGGEIISPYAEGTIRYTFQPTIPGRTAEGSFIAWTNRYSIEESDIPGTQGRESFRTNLQFRYAITARIAGSLDLSYLHGSDRGAGTNFSSGQEVFDIAPSLQYSVTRYLNLSVGYRHSENDGGSRPVGTGQFGSLSFSRNRYFAGVNVTF